mgnify:CR=1 FL=1
MNEDVKSENVRIHSRADELIACLEGEIAKRDEELAACRVAVENCEVFRARIAELEARIVWLECEAQVNAAPVSEAKAQDFDPLVCDYCNAETQDPWHGSGMLNGAESRHIHACDQCRNLLPTAKALAVRDEEIERIRVQLMTIASADPARHSIEWAKAVAATGNNEAYAKWREAFDERDQQAQRVAELEQILRDLVPGCKWRFMRPRIDAALSAGKEGE